MRAPHRELGERVRGVGVVDDRDRMGAAAEHFHPARRAWHAPTAASACCSGTRQPSNAERRKQVLGVERADEPGTELAGAPAALDMQHHPVACPHPGEPDPADSRRGDEFASVENQTAIDGVIEHLRKPATKGSRTSITAACNPADWNSRVFASPYASSVPW